MVQKKGHKSKPKSQKARFKPKDGKELEAQLEVLGLRIVQITADGNCLFRAVADQLEGNEEQHLKYRQMVVDYIEAHRVEYEPFLEDEVPFDDYCKNMRELSTWAGHMELQVISLVTRTNICIHKLSSPRWHIQNFESTKVHCIHLSYHNGEHYNSVRRKDDNGGEPAKSILLEMPVMEERKDAKGNASKKGNFSQNSSQKKAQPACVEKRIFDEDFEETATLADSKDEEDLHTESKGDVHTKRPLQQVQRGARNKACPCGSKRKYKACCGAVRSSNKSQEMACSANVELSNKARKQKLRNNKGAVQAKSEGVNSPNELPNMSFLCI